MEKSPFERLTTRHRDCLRLVASNHSTKEIAKSLNISPNTVDGYISEAIVILGAATRREAAREFQKFSADPVPDAPPETLGGEISRVAVEAADAQSVGGDLGSLSVIATGPTGVGAAVKTVSSTSEGAFHWLRGDREHNTLTSKQRLLWIAMGSVISAFLFVAAVTSIDTLSRLLSSPAP
jgi:DNA-binding CsgD family transcriptional regulator